MIFYWFLFNETKRRVEGRAAELDYQLLDETIVFTHTGVPPERDRASAVYW